MEVKLVGIERENCLIPLTALNELHFLWFMRSEPTISGFREVLKNKMTLAIDKRTSRKKVEFTLEGKNSWRTGPADKKAS